jgi:hypothetical protein
LSAFIAVRKKASIDLLVDAVQFDPLTGVVGAIASKVFPLPGKAVITGRALMKDAEAFSRGAMAVCATFDETLERFPEIIARNPAKLRDHNTHLDSGYLDNLLTNHELLVAGWSEARNRPETYVAVAGKDSPLRDLGGLVGGGPQEGLKELAAMFSGPDGTLDEEYLETFDPVMHGAFAFETMRRERLPLELGNPDAVEGHGVGGFLEHVVISGDGALRQVIGAWPDDVGRVIGPERTRAEAA